jgi:hypothetical protein
MDRPDSGEWFEAVRRFNRRLLCECLESIFSQLRYEPAQISATTGLAVLACIPSCTCSSSRRSSNPRADGGRVPAVVAPAAPSGRLVMIALSWRQTFEQALNGIRNQKSLEPSTVCDPLGSMILRDVDDLRIRRQRGVSGRVRDLATLPPSALRGSPASGVAGAKWSVVPSAWWLRAREGSSQSRRTMRRHGTDVGTSRRDRGDCSKATPIRLGPCAAHAAVANPSVLRPPAANPRLDR